MAKKEKKKVEPKKQKIEKIKGKVLSIEELIEKNPRGIKVKILC